MEQKPIINCHTHIFTGDHVPPLLARTFIPEPFHLLLPLRPIVALFRWWYKHPARIPYKVWFKKLVKAKTAVHAFFTRLYPLNIIAGYYVFLLSFFTLYNLVAAHTSTESTRVTRILDRIYKFLDPIFPDIGPEWLRILLVVFVFAFFKSIRNLLLFAAGLLWKAVRSLPGKQTREMANRYLNIGRYAFHRQQGTILSKLKDQYPAGTRFIILPMDMEYMAAGESKIRYRDQMQELQKLKQGSHKSAIYPFVFADPRRMVPAKEEKRWKDGDKIYFDWSLDAAGRVKLEDCFIRDYLEEHGFSGIKIYPALGYYPFDVKLLPLWKYCEQHGIPILTHCIRGTIFYRGPKKQEWNSHPVFCQAMERIEADDDGYKNDEALEREATVTRYEPLVLPQAKNADFSYNFTHPLNYLCLLEEHLLRKVLTNAMADKRTERKDDLARLFGYTIAEQKLSNDLKQLKICLGHFGGDDEWKRYFEKDRYNYSSQLAKHPCTGIRFFKTHDNQDAPGKPEQLWKWSDWYSIICSMILQYPAVYADISYILHGDADILPLLKQTLQNPGLRKKILYGTDFFVVRNHKSDKNMLADWMGGLEPEDFDQIARCNPRDFLQRSVPA